jgi:hypothetical protein
MPECHFPRRFFAILIFPGLFLAAANAATEAATESNLLLVHSGSSPGANWTHLWKAGYGCSRDFSRSSPDGTRIEVLRQSLPADFAKGNHSWTQRVAVQSGAEYQFRVRYKTDGARAAFAQFHFVYPDGSYMPWLNFRETSKTLAETQPDWAELNHDFTVPAGAAAVQVALRLNSPGTVWWDAPSLVKRAAPGDFAYVEDAQPYDLRDSTGVVLREFPIDKLIPLNVRWARYNINWADIEKAGPDQWNEEYLERAVKQITEARAAGIRTMVSLGYAPRWAARKNEGVNAGNVVAKEIRDWQHYVAVVVGRLGDLVEVYRIMNEVNHQWDTGAQPREYARFLKTAYTTIKAIRPRATVVMAGVSGTPGGYLQGIYDAGGKGFFDVAACQPYVHGRQNPEEGHLVARLQAYRMVMAANGDNSPIWATEYGYPSGPLERITLEEQAGLYVRSHLLALGSEAGVNRFFHYILRQTPPGNGDSITQSGGLYTSDWRIKPLGIAVGTLGKIINPVRRYVGEVNPGSFNGDGALHNRLFETSPGGDHVWAIWRTRGESEFPLSFAHPVEMIAWDGESAGVSTTHRARLGHLPVYFTGPMPDIAARSVKTREVSYATTATNIERNIITVPWTDSPPSAAASAPSAAPSAAPALSAGPVFELAGRRNPESGIVARGRVTTSAEGVYIAIDIDDTSPASNTVGGFSGVWAQDSVEVFVNTQPENAPAGFVTNDCHHFIASPGRNGENARVYWADQGARSIRKILPGSRIRITLRPDGKGYAFGFFIGWKEWIDRVPRKGDLMGFDLFATRSSADGNREETGVWHGNLENDKDASLWGVIRLGKSKQ